MAKTNKFDFEFELSHKSISNFVSTVKEYRLELEKSKTAILEALASYTHERVVQNIAKTVGNGTYVPTDELINNIKISEIIDDMVRVIADTEYAAFVEFGTGIVGSESPNPKASDYGWTYGEKGWVYQASNGQFYYTEGMEAHNFMYDAWLDLKANYRTIIKKVLRERGLI